jgi:hypothetical protein
MRDGSEVSVSLQTLGKATVAFPFSALVFCLSWSFIRDFEKATYTHCEVDQFAPSISSVIGDFTPQHHVWNICIAIVFTPRLLFARMYYRYFQERLPVGRRTLKLVSVNYALNVAENVSLLGLSFVPSSDIFVVHEVFFITFMATSMVSMALTVGFLYPRCGFQARTIQEQFSISVKSSLVKVIFSCAVCALYFYWRHNEYCEPYVYSFFAVCEYSIVVSNIFYHGMAFYDFYDSHVRVSSDVLPK